MTPLPCLYTSRDCDITGAVLGLPNRNVNYSHVTGVSLSSRHGASSGCGCRNVVGYG